MTLSLVRTAIAPFTKGISADAWTTDEELRAQKVKLFRDYMDGDHRANLTPEMRRMLRVSDTGSLNEFNVNYCPTVISTESDRIRLTGITADAQAMTDWCAQVFADNRLDALQLDIHEATLRDARSFLLVDYDNDARRVRFTHEPAFDGNYGVIPFYATRADRLPLFAVKLWRVTTNEVADTVRVNVYHPDRIDRYVSVGEGNGSLVRYEDDGQSWTMAWTMKDGSPLGVPLIPFVNRATTYMHDGKSELEDVIPLQDVANRNLYSMTMTAELMAFAIRVFIGDQAPAAVTPGMILSYYATDASGNPAPPNSELMQKWLESIRLEQWDVSDLTGYIEQAKWLKSQIYEITNTPNDSAAEGASGESLKQREIELLGKVQRFQTRNGNAWEDAFALAHRVQQTYGTVQPPAYTELTAKWKDAQVRNKKEIIELANAVKDHVDHRTYLELIAEVFDWTPEKIDQIVNERKLQDEAKARMEARGFAEGVFNDAA